MPDDKVSWRAAFPGYQPQTWTDEVVEANERGKPTGRGWADPPISLALAAISHAMFGM